MLPQLGRTGDQREAPTPSRPSLAVSAPAQDLQSGLQEYRADMLGH